MRIPDGVLESVCFISVIVKTAHGETDFFIGTGFFVSLPSAIPNRRYTYLVTAKHVIQGAKAQGFSEFFIRLNTADGGSVIAAIPDDWLYPDNPAADVAVMPVTIGKYNPALQFRTNPIDSIATDEFLQEHSIGVGDDLIIVGLFSQRWGHRRNIPIVRSGIIASMPDEPFMDEPGELYDAYLVEMRSIGGLSGSPVFVFMDALRAIPDRRMEYDFNNLEWRLALIGVIRGHWELQRQDAVSDNAGASQEASEIDRLNTGIAQVTPIQEVLAILNREELVKERQRIEEEALRRQKPRLDANLPQGQGEPEEGFTREDFENALRRSSQKIPSEPESEKRED